LGLVFGLALTWNDVIPKLDFPCNSCFVFRAFILDDDGDDDALAFVGS